MNLSDSLATLNRDRFREWELKHTGDAVRPAIQAFRGDVYVGLDADTLDDDDLTFAQNHLRILSGLYGVLKPLDVMRAYRLEMGTRVFHDEKNGEYKIISFFAKRARGALARYLITERAKTPEALKDFSGLGYRYSKRESTENAPEPSRAILGSFISDIA